MLAGHGPVDQIEVEVRGVEVRQRLVDLRADGCLAIVDLVRPHLCREQHNRGFILSDHVWQNCLPISDEEKKKKK